MGITPAVVMEAVVAEDGTKKCRLRASDDFIARLVEAQQKYEADRIHER